MKITSFAEANEILNSYVPQQIKNTGKHFHLDRMGPLLEAAGNPHEKLKVVHVAGTSGKTSTTYYITALLAAAGQKVGTTVSPHVDSVTERVQINGHPIGESDFTEAFSEFMQLLEGKDIDTTYFEIIVVFALWFFVRQNVDYAVLETGLGGLLDATNVVQRPDKVCVITDIGYDHMAILGNTLPEIAAQKAGIIHEHNHALMHEQAPEIMAVFERRCADKHAQLEVIKDVQQAGLSDLPGFQSHNWQLAYAAYQHAQKRDNLPELTDEKLQTTMHVQVPARMDIVTVSGKTIVMDGAHNAQKMQAFVDGFVQKYPGQKATILLSLKAGKEHAEVLPELARIADELIITSFNLVQDTPLHSMDLQELASEAQKHIPHVRVVEDQNQAYQQLLRSDAGILVVTGSFYMIGQLRAQHKELRNA